MIKFSNFKTIIVLVILVSIASVSLFPVISHAALVPCGRSDQAGTPDEMCTLCHFIIGIKGLIDYGFKIMVVVALAMIIIAAVVYIVSAGNEGMMTTAKSLLKNVLIGFSIILGAWLIVNTAMLVIGAKGNLGVERVSGSWTTFQCTAKSSVNSGN